jgi:hypothetical protein
VLAESLMVKGGSYVGVGLGEGERDAVSHREILAGFRGTLILRLGVLKAFAAEIWLGLSKLV